ncbi:MAG: nucleoside recognition domain-containing protein [Bacillota bacterium]|nr:nucleoside recognition domain-containing protein [Bacillota bacterium]
MRERLDHIISKPLGGALLVFSILAGIYLFIGKFIAGPVVDFTQGTLMGNWYYNFVVGYLSAFMDRDNFLPFLLFGEYGLLTMTPIYLLGLLLPLVFSFYLALHLLKDSGLLTRVSYSVQGIFRHLGLSGEGIIPLLLGFGCVTAALISVNSLSSKREQLIVSILLCLAIPCSAQFAIILAISSFLPFKYIIVYLSVVLMLFIVTGLLLKLLIPGEPSTRAPSPVPLRIPGFFSSLTLAIRASWDFLVDAAPTFAFGGLLMALLSYTGGFQKIHQWCSPITSGLLQLPDRATDLFMLAIIKKDLGAAEMYAAVSQGSFSDIQITVILIVMTLFVPCFASLMVLYKDRGPLIASLTWAGSFLLSFSVGAVISRLLRLGLLA